VIEEQKAKALFAGGVALFVTGLVVLMLFVIPAARHTQVAMAQDEEMAEPEAMPGDEDMGMPPGMEGMPGGPAAAAPAPAPQGATADPLEPSRPNPFSARSRVAGAEVTAAMALPHYGPDWSQLPIAERIGFVTPEIPDAPTPPLPRIERAPEADVRITSILWDASGQAIAAYEDAEGDSGELRPGDRVPGTGMTVQEITRTGVTISNPRTGEVQDLDLRPRVEKKEEPAPRRQPRRQPRGGGGGGGFPAAPPGG
jgi:hypothetical protein